MQVEICSCCGKPKKPKGSAIARPARNGDGTTALGGGWQEAPHVTAPATELAQTWAGHRYGLQALKPAVEPILVFQKPYEGSAIDSITATGAGALNIDQARIGTEPIEQHGRSATSGTGWGVHWHNDLDAGKSWSGRWPTNLVLSHSPLCNGHCAPGCPVAALGAQSGESESKASMRGLQVSGAHGGLAQGTGQIKDGTNGQRGHNDVGTAARFFFNADYLCERLENADAVIYEAKASQGEREAGLDPRQLALLNQAEINPQTRRESADWGRRIGASGEVDRRNFPEQTINDGREKPIDNPYQRGETTRRNIHPTIKPIALARHLATLLLPPDAYTPRRLLIPFAGAGSEMIGALLAGWEEIVGVELEAEHVAIAQARLAYWRQRLHEFGDPAKAVRATLAEAPAGQIDMFGES